MELMTLNPGTGNCGDHMVMAVAGDHELSVEVTFQKADTSDQTY